MTTALEAVRSRIVSDAEAFALVGQNVHGGVAPDITSPAAKYVVIQRIATNPDNTLEGASGLQRILFQVSCIARDFDSAEALRSAVKAAVTGSDGDGFRSLVIDERDQYFNDISRHDAQFDVAIWFNE